MRDEILSIKVSRTQLPDCCLPKTGVPRPLWGLRTRARFMHDGASLTPRDAILRHDGEARFVISNFRNLTDLQKNQLLNFLRSL